MKLLNLTKQSQLSDNLKIADNLWLKLAGKIILSKHAALFLETRFGIHTLMMNKAIDVLILDNRWQVVKIKKNLRPYSFYFWPFQFSRVVELPEGTIVKSKVQLGDKLQISS